MSSCDRLTLKGAESIASLTELRHLDLSDCCVDDKALKHISRLTKLQVLKLKG